MKTTLLVLVLVALSACGKVSSTGSSPVDSLVGTWKLTSGPSGAVVGGTLVYNQDNSCAFSNSLTTRPATDTCSFDGTTLKITSKADGLTDDYAATISGNQLSILLAELPVSYTITFSRQ